MNLPTASRRGGYRGTSATARFSAQLVALVTPSTRERVRKMATATKLSQAKIMRAIINAGIEEVEKGLAEGRLSADTLV